jgi:hypothetical protein
VQPTVLDVQGVATGRRSLAEQDTLGSPSGMSTVAVMLCGRFNSRGAAKLGIDWVPG